MNLESLYFPVCSPDSHFGQQIFLDNEMRAQFDPDESDEEFTRLVKSLIDDPEENRATADDIFNCYNLGDSSNRLYQDAPVSSGINTGVNERVNKYFSLASSDN